MTCVPNGHGGMSCHNICSTKTTVTREPRQYVQDLVPMVTACGFDMVDGEGLESVPEDVRLRVANPGIEKNWWVKISVNGYNVTNAEETDERVWCLWRLGEKQK
jgi:hypothetical protein